MTALLDLQRVAKKLNLSREIILYTNFSTQCQRELQKMYMSKEEFDVTGSYFPYASSMNIVEKSLYSVSENQCSHVYHMTLISLSGE